MRRIAIAVPTVMLMTASVLSFTAGSAMAQGPHKAKAAHSTKAAHHTHKAKPHKVKALVTMTGIISDTPTATIATGGTASDTATSTITIAVKGGARELHGKTVVVTLDKNTVVRRNGPASATDLAKGDHVSVRARRMPDGSWLALRVNASPRPSESAEPSGG